jgi:hypothetical protein
MPMTEDDIRSLADEHGPQVALAALTDASISKRRREVIADDLKAALARRKPGWNTMTL